MTFHDFGDPVDLAVTITDANGDPANATAVVCTVTYPDGTDSDLAVVNADTGVYQAAFTPTLAGRHLVNWVATGTNASAYTDIVDVAPSDPRFIISLADARDVLNLAATNTTHDEELRGYLAAATVVIEAIDRPILRQTRTWTVNGGRHAITLPYVPIASVESVTVNGTVWDASTYAVDETAGIVYADNTTFPAGLRNVEIEYVAGEQVIPPNVILAAKELVRHWWQRSQQSPRPAFGGGITDTDAVYVANYTVPNFVIGLLQPAGIV